MESFGIVKSIVYYKYKQHGPDGPLGSKVQSACVIVDFASIPTGQSLIPGCPATFVLVAPVTIRCRRKCCIAAQIPLRVCKAMSIHKCQGCSCGEDEVWESAW